MGKKQDKKNSLENQRQELLKSESKKFQRMEKTNLNEYRVTLTNPIEIKKDKVGLWSKIKSELTIGLSIVALLVSCFSVYKTNKRNDYLETTNFNIVQNFWQEHPSYTLYNESQKPLTSPPQPSYYLYIPAKLYYIFKDGTRYSSLILLPVSYENVISQTSTGKTIDEIETSVLSKNFYGKLGNRDLRSKIYGKPGKDNVAFELRVYPFLAIATYIEYSYKDNPKKIMTEKFITTPWNKEKLTDDRFLDLENYTRNIAHFPENEVVVKGNENVYDSAFKYLESQFNNLLPMFFSGFRTEEDQQRFYALIGTKWDMTYDPDKDIAEYAKPSRNNFNSLGRKLSDKVIPAKDPLYPNY
ncbi:hypothetical protein [Streptococcus macacae]|uniref:Uncharacterized protein n=1 Tax=Streptococcus macacae NCTC 11558 TaxID=764298 RepID=G5JUH3_9STRE|nr:hypothetical protein [Streptococcus macacae]EHJ52852.1 hypothetical protein STRMA_0800 [Streptococcus macacae NCTC 11558]SUN78615.1 Uncharacterised protein [Streptococcus macacae NCTC 11558]